MVHLAYTAITPKSLKQHKHIQALKQDALGIFFCAHKKQKPSDCNRWAFYFHPPDKSKGKKLVVEIIAVVLQKVEVVMEKHGYWKVTGAILMGIFIWQLSNIINAFVALAKVFQ